MDGYMDIQSPFIIIETIAVVLCIVATGIAWRFRRGNPINMLLILFLLMVIVWLFSSIGGLSSASLSINQNWAKIEYLAVVSVPFLVFYYSLHYSNFQKWLTRKKLILLLMIPVVTLLMAWTNDLHGLIWSQYSVYQDSGLTIPEITYGSWFWVYWVYSYLLLLVATILIIRSISISGRPFRIHGLLIVLAILSPWIGNLIYVLNLSPIENLDLTPLAFALTGLLLSAGMLRWQLFDIVPIARSRVIENLVDAVIVFDQLDRIVDANLKAESIFGIDIHKVSGKRSNDVLPTVLSLPTEKIKGEKQHFELTLEHKGENRLFEVNRTVIYDRQDIQNGSLIILHDITERDLIMKRLVEVEKTLRVSEMKRSAGALSVSEDKYKAIFDEAKDGIVLVDINDGSISDCNLEFEKQTGRSLTQLRKMKIWQIRPTEKAEAARNKFFQIKESGSGDSSELSFQKPNGEIVDIEFKSKVISIGNKKYAQGISRDITERIMAEQEKEKLEAQLVQAQKMEAIGTLAGGIAHDFNNLLTVIMGYSQMALRDLQKEDPMYSGIEEIEKAGERAAALTRQLLIFSRQQQFNLQITDLNEIITNSEKMLRRVIPENIEIEIKLEPDIGNVRVDPGQVDQVIMNLAVNARDAMPKGGRIIIRTQSCSFEEETIQPYSDAKVGDFACLFIKDTGAGMDKETLKHIFEPFYTTKETGKGTGLGLSTVFGIVKQHGGWINVYSEPDKGTSFMIYIPIVKEEKEEKVKESVEDLKGKGEVVLVVEDESGVLAFAKKVLEKNNYKVLAASTAKEALKVFEKEEGKIDLVFSDIVLPDINGIELMDKLTAKAPKLRFLLSSGYTERDENVSKRLQEEGIEFIQKPYSMASFLKAIRGALV
jgi:two-component system cell cycle sensor histidine kinase/response regulator CckA